MYFDVKAVVDAKADKVNFYLPKYAGSWPYLSNLIFNHDMHNYSDFEQPNSTSSTYIV